MERQDWADYSKGIAIFLVVLCHSQNGLDTAGLFKPNQSWHYFDDLSYTFMVPAFFTIAGYFSIRSQTRRGLKKFSIGLLNTIVYPYFLWSIIQILLMMVTGASNARPTWETILLLPITAYAQFWFLYALFFCYMFDILLSLINVSKPYKLLISVILLILTFEFSHLWTPVYWLSSHYLYFCLGAILSIEFVHQFSSRLLFANSVVIFIFLNFLVSNKVNIESPLRFVGAITGISFIIMLSILLERIKKFEWIKILGIYSLQIYCLHTIASASSRYLIQHVLKSHDFWILSISGTIAGLFIPVLFAILNDKYRLKFFRLV